MGYSYTQLPSDINVVVQALIQSQSSVKQSKCRDITRLRSQSDDGYR